MSEQAADNRNDGGSTANSEYARRLLRLDRSPWRRALNVQAPYRWNIRRLHLGRTLDVGCGLGRNLAHLGGSGVGVDHNAESIAIAKQRGLQAYTIEEFFASPHAEPAGFDSILLSHVAEHVSASFAVDLVAGYLEFLKPGGTVCFITPQEAGYRSDATHVTFVDFEALEMLCRELGLVERRRYSFPFPRFTGRFFPYNEFVMLAAKP